MSYELDISDLWPSSDVRYRNEAKSVDPDKHSSYPCYICGSPVKKDCEAWRVFTGGGPVMVPHEDFTDVNDSGFMGAHPVGPTCDRKLKRLFKATFGERLDVVRKRGPQ